MMKRTLLAAAITLLLAGCALPPNQQAEAHRNYIAWNRPLAEQGKMKWSGYYKGLYSSALSLSPLPPASYLNRINDLIRNAEDYEAGRITEEQFQYQRRAATAGEMGDAQARQQAQAQSDAATAAYLGAAATILQNSGPRPIAPMPAPTMTNCRSVYQGSGVVQTNCY